QRVTLQDNREIYDPNDQTGRNTCTLTINGSFVIFQDFEITNIAVSPPPASTGRLNRFDPVPNGTGERLARPGGVLFNAPYSSCRHLIIHDTGSVVFQFDYVAIGSEIYGCIVYNNGVQSIYGNEGYGVYTSNDVGTGHKKIRNNLFLNNYGFGIHAFIDPSKPTLHDVWGYEIDANVFAQCGIHNFYGPIYVQPRLVTDRGFVIPSM